MAVRIANGAGFLGDRPDAPRCLVEAAEVDYLTLEYLAELTMSILARWRQTNPDYGFAADFIRVLQTLCDPLRSQQQLRIVTNAGGVNPVSCAVAAARILDAEDLKATKIAVVSGDDLLERLDQLQAAGCEFENLETGQTLAERSEPIVCANAYLGAAPIADALAASARLVISGRVADASLTVAPAVFTHGWPWDDWDALAQASVAGHLIECGAQVTGGYATEWRDRQLEDIGYPIAEISRDGTSVITKPPGTGGVVNRQTVTEQLVYEIGDPAHYLTPDVDVDFTTVELREAGQDRVQVTGACGAPPPDSYKVSLAYQAGYRASDSLLVYGDDCLEKAEECAEIVFGRVRQRGWNLDQVHVECLGSGNAVPGVATANRGDRRELVLRMSVQSQQREAVEQFTREVAPLITSGPAGLAGYASGRAVVHPAYVFWPTSVPKDQVAPRVEVRSAEELLREHSA